MTNTKTFADLVNSSKEISEGVSFIWLERQRRHWWIANSSAKKNRIIVMQFLWIEELISSVHGWGGLGPPLHIP